MSVNRVQVIWAGNAAQGGGLSTFYFNSTVGTAAQQVAAVAAFLNGIQANISTQATWQTSGDVATLNIGTGVLEAVTSVAQSTGAGTASGDMCPPATQGLVRALTNVVVAGRLLRGRIFIPGVPEASNGSSGGPVSGYRTAIDAAAATLLGDANTEWSVWSLTHGVLASVTAANTWSKFATLRSRRD